ncbi:sigma 54-interacting transcriptional regulator [Orbus sasakiae]|uniref:Sigma 54-interacting transcriptional regulator n=1 Tax=Orbus sasakiae TaxID=1078475 RepID=A0ABP9N115_9GAMM
MSTLNEKLDEYDLSQITKLSNDSHRMHTLRLQDEAWIDFVEQGSPSPHIRDKIFSSWTYSRELGIDPYHGHQKIVDQLTLHKVLQEHQELISIADHIMMGLLAYNHKGHINLTTADGITLHSCGLDITPIGSILTEEVQGTNCTGRCIIEKKIVYVLSTENYSQSLRKRNMDCAATPIFDANHQIIGILTLTMGENEFFHYHTLGTVQAAADAISRQMQLQRALETEKMFIESFDEGVIVIDNFANIHVMNNYARKLFFLDISLDPIKYHLSQIAHFTDEQIMALIDGNKHQDQEITIRLNNNQLLQCIVSVIPIRFSHFVLSIHEKKRIHKMAQKMMGSHARYHFDSIVGQSKLLLEAISIGKLSSQTDSTVLILGDSGTGKEMFAQAIHNASARCDEPFIAVNCGALPRELVQSELFGYVEGAFTGAKRGGAPGKFELANGGTLFLDEIGDMPIEAQINLLRVIQENEIIRVGGNQSQKIDVRIIAATNKDLYKLVENNAFRQDLYYRLNVIAIHIPSLKQRIDDLPLLMHHFQKKICLALNKPIVEFSPEVTALFYHYDWPGNVRELENLIERCIHFSQNAKISLLDIPNGTLNMFKQPSFHDGITHESNRLQHTEKTHIVACLQATHGNLRKSALQLGVSRGTLYNKLIKYQIDPNRYRR